MERILAATDFSSRSQRALRRAGLLAQQTGAQLTLLHVVDEDQPPHLIELERAEGEAILNEQVGSVAELQGIHCRVVVTLCVAFDAIVRAAEATSADLIGSSCCEIFLLGRRSSVWFARAPVPL